MVLLPTGDRIRNRDLGACIGAAVVYYLFGFSPLMLAAGAGAGYYLGEQYSNDNMSVDVEIEGGSA